MQELFYFYHIPKTAGYSITNFLKYHKRVLKVRSTDPMHEWFDGDFSKYDGICGHLNFRASQYYSSDIYYLKEFTLLRNPLERTLSHINYDYAGYIKDLETGFETNEKRSKRYKDLQENYFNYFNKRKDLRLEAFLECDLFKKKYSNRQTYYLSSNKELNYVLFDSNNFLPDNESLTIAKKRLDNMEFVGVTERIDDFLSLLCKELNLLENNWTIPYKNVIPHKKWDMKDLSNDCINKIKMMNQLDYELYSYTKSKFDEKMCQYKKGN